MQATMTEPTASKADSEASTIEAIAQALRVHDVATWQGWTVRRVPCSIPATVRVTCMEQGGTCYSIDYLARTGPLPFDRLDVSRALHHLGATLAPAGWAFVD